MTTTPVIPVTIDGVVQRRSDSATQGNARHCLMLTETGGGRWMRIGLGKCEATALVVSLISPELPRPPTYQLTAAR